MHKVYTWFGFVNGQVLPDLIRVIQDTCLNTCEQYHICGDKSFAGAEFVIRSFLHFSSSARTFRSFRLYMLIQMSVRRPLNIFVTHLHFSSSVMVKGLMRCLALVKNDFTIVCGCILDVSMPLYTCCKDETNCMILHHVLAKTSFV